MLVKGGPQPSASTSSRPAEHSAAIVLFSNDLDKALAAMILRTPEEARQKLKELFGVGGDLPDPDKEQAEREKAAAEREKAAAEREQQLQQLQQIQEELRRNREERQQREAAQAAEAEAEQQEAQQ